MWSGLPAIGMPGAKHGVCAIDPAIVGLLKPHGCMTGRFGNVTRSLPDKPDDRVALTDRQI
jgi:hypothetical protein